MTALAVALELEGVSLRALAISEDARNLVVIFIRQSAIEDAEIVNEMRAVARADNDGGHHRPIQHRPARQRCDIHIVPVPDSSQRLKQHLEKIPSAEIVDDKLVFGERTVLEGWLRLRPTQPRVA